MEKNVVNTVGEIPTNLEVLDTPKEILQNLIHTVRGQQVMLDSDLAALYQVETRRLNEAVKRNIERFPEKFRFRLTEEEYLNLKSQFATSSFRLSTKSVANARAFLIKESKKVSIYRTFRLFFGIIKL